MQKPAPTRARLRGLYVVTPDVADTASLIRDVSLALAGGAAVVQYRHKGASADVKWEQAQALRALCHTHQRPLIINDDIALALAVGADGVHLGRDDGDLAAARRALGPQRWLGVSCYNELPRATRAVAAGADYIAFGALFPSATKPLAATAPLTLLESARALHCPIAAIGGITLDHAPAVIRAGADLLAVITDVFNAPDITARAAGYARLFDDSHLQRPAP